MSKHDKPMRPITQKMKKQRHLPPYYKMIEILKQYQVLLYNEQFFQLGKGSFGKCYLGKIVKKQGEKLENYQFDQLVKNDELIAVKVIEKSQEKTNYQAYLKEITILHDLVNVPRNPPINTSNIVKIIFPKSIQSQRHYYIVTEYCNNCSLYDLIQTRKEDKRKWTLWEFIQLALDLVYGYRAIKSCNITHNDLKPKNIFIKDKCFKIGDFGLAVKLSSNGKVPLGTPLYAAPEKLRLDSQKTDIDHKADVYSLGVILFEAMFGCHPYMKVEQYQKFRYYQEGILKKDVGFKKYSQKQLKNYIIYLYLQCKSKEKRSFQPLLQHQPEFSPLVQQLIKLVNDMCCLDKKERLTLDLVVDRMRGMNLETYIKREDLFSDLHKLSQSQLRFQLSNMTKVGSSTVQTNSIRNSLNIQMTQPITMEKVRVMKERLFAMFKFFELSRSLREEVKGVGLYEENSEEFQQLLTNYLYEVNLRQIRLISQQLIDMQQHEMKVATRENVLTDLRKLKQNDEVLFNDARVDPQDDEQTHRNRLVASLKDRWFNEPITYQNWSDALAWVLLFSVIIIEKRYRNSENKRQMEKQLQKVQENMLLFKLQALSAQECDRGLQLLRQFAHEFNYYESFE